MSDHCFRCFEPLTKVPKEVVMCSDTASVWGCTKCKKWYYAEKNAPLAQAIFGKSTEVSHFMSSEQWRNRVDRNKSYKERVVYQEVCDAVDDWLGVP